MKRLTALAAVLAAWAGAAGAADTLESLEAKIAERWEGVSSYKADMTVTADVAQSLIRVNSTLTGPMTLEKGADGKVRYRSELRGSATMGPLGLLKFDIRTLMVSTGDTTYTETRMRDKVQVTIAPSAKAGDTAPEGGAQKMSDMEKDYTLRVLPEKQVDGRAVFVVEGQPKPHAKEKLPQLDRVVMFIDQQTGIQTRLALLDKDNQLLTEVRWDNLTLNPPIPSGLFDYSIPPGAEVKDKREGA